MPNRREPLKRRWSTAALLAGGLAGIALGIVLGARFADGMFLGSALLPPPATPTASPPAPARVTDDRPRPSVTDTETKWRQCLARPPSQARDEEMARVLESLAAEAPALAVALAQEESNLALRQSLLAAAVRGWARVAPRDAARWALQRPLAERALAAAAVLDGAAGKPADALALAAGFVRDDPALAHDHGCALVFALARVGEFDAAASFAAAGPDAHRGDWLRTAFTVWAEHQPENAVSAAAALTEPALRTEAFQAAVAGWTATNPAGLAEFSTRLASDPDRAYALKSALGEWVQQDLVAASNWLNRRDPSADLDAGAVAVATSSTLVTRRPEVALSWAESVTDVELRSGTIATVLRAWAKTAPADARRYAESSPNLRATDRSAVLADFGAAPSS